MSLPSSGCRDRQVGLRSLLVGHGREALDELARDPDDDLLRPEAGHLLGLLERDGAVVDDGRDVGDGARLHVGEALALPTDALTTPWPPSISNTSALANSVPDVERGAGGQAPPGSLRVQSRRRTVIGSATRARRGPTVADQPRAPPDAVALRAAALGHLGPAAALAVDRGDRDLHELAGRDAFGDRRLVGGHEDLRLVAHRGRAPRRWRPAPQRRSLA